MIKKFLNARSPLRLLERGLHGGLGAGNLGVVLAGHGVGKTSFLVGVALDDLLRGADVLHVALDQTVAHLRDHYDTVFADLAASTHLADPKQTHAEIERHRSIRAYSGATFDAAKLREAAKLENEAGRRLALIVLEGFDLDDAGPGEIGDLASLARELGAEIWLSVACADEKIRALPPAVSRAQSLLSVILALEPGDGTVALRALKDHDNPDVSALHVALDPRTLLLVRS
jgi:hypothetical protein